ncbi:MAG: Dabb family protein [Flavobacteriaceae bacterium]|nr:Dabb family protein [Flavobacteriaceae bacterium]
MKFSKVITIGFLIVFLNSCTNTSKAGYYHVLLLEYAANTPQTEITNDVLGFKKIPDVIDVVIGKIKPNKRNPFSNFNYSVVLTFKNKKGLENYLKHPYHVKIYNKHKPYIKAIYTADFDALK